jgi:pilus assembly protein CpaB
LNNVRVIAIDQELAQGTQMENLPPAKKGAAPQQRFGGKLSQTVSLELAPEQVKRITVARQLGTLSLVIRSAVDQWNTKDSGSVSSCDVSAELARQNAIAGQRTQVAVHVPGKVEQVMVRKQNADENEVRCDDGTRPAGLAGRLPGKR